MWGSNWVRLGFDSWLLGIEAANVMGLRTMALAAGDANALREANLMVREKIDAARDLHLKAATGALGLTPSRAAQNTVAHYRRKVRANRRRLTR